jgi:hypothetical protein
MLPMAPLPDPRTLLQGQIAALAAAAQHCPLPQLVEGIDAVRRTARGEGLADVALLASRLESAIAVRGRSAVILSYLDAMAQALAAGDATPRDSAATNSGDNVWLASIAVRFAN